MPLVIRVDAVSFALAVSVPCRWDRGSTDFALKIEEIPPVTHHYTVVQTLSDSLGPLNRVRRR
ncbi:hypothetical protein ASPTUDRAFT_37796 [Aspergillus tubingensis CBS 134.48]|uniref:Uncharacterized protein n=1 Tax=Aspergillus tubingensis (strain CBS 134.48) TaxID=767770 RepID=A0A1L9NP20_ASPTC|nr:hypothetical protein ASPTUDRAFT_37796 [Aspergillus tubingensis CBS 134.48]